MAMSVRSLLRARSVITCTPRSQRCLATIAAGSRHYPSFQTQGTARATAVPSASLLSKFFCTSSLAIAAKGSRVKVEYVSKLDDGTVFDSSENEGGAPLDFTVGAEQVFPGLDHGVEGMAFGETKELVLGPADAFGEHDAKGVRQVSLSKLPAGCEVGAELETESGYRSRVIKIEEDMATMDLNHPLAGVTLHFSVTLVSCHVPQVVLKTATPGDGQTFPKKGDTLKVHYTGTLAQFGTQFDSSLDEGEPLSFEIGAGQVIQGWEDGLFKMSLGEKALLQVPASLGYGAKGHGTIPANADLEFELELLQIN